MQVFFFEKLKFMTAKNTTRVNDNPDDGLWIINFSFFPHKNKKGCMQKKESTWKKLKFKVEVNEDCTWSQVSFLLKLIQLTNRILSS